MNTLLSNTLLFLFSSSLMTQADEPNSKLLDDFKTTSTIGTWISVNDGVMGGLSKGGPKINQEKKMVFKGEISLANNGGFSSIRTRGSVLSLSNYNGLEIKIKGDGRMYYLTSRSNSKRMLAFWSPIQPAKNEWTVIRVPFDSFYATYFGKKIPMMSLNTKKITSIGLMLYDKQGGSFEIETEYIKAYKDDEVE